MLRLTVPGEHYREALLREGESLLVIAARAPGLWG